MSDPTFSDLYDGSFGGTGFWQQGSPFLPDFEGGLDSQEVRYLAPGTPGLNSNGLKLQRLSLPIACDGDEYTALQGKKGDTHTLVYHAGSVTAVLDDIQKPEKLHPYDIWRATLVFVKEP